MLLLSLYWTCSLFISILLLNSIFLPFFTEFFFLTTFFCLVFLHPVLLIYDIFLNHTKTLILFFTPSKLHNWHFFPMRSYFLFNVSICRLEGPYVCLMHAYLCIEIVILYVFCSSFYWLCWILTLTWSCRKIISQACADHT